MASRVEPHDSLDFFPTPPFATRALCEWLKSIRCDLASLSAWEPACGAGDMAKPLAEYFATVRATDVHDYGYGEQADFLWPTTWTASWIVTNPPFRLGEQFAHKAIERSRSGCALLVRTSFLESAARFNTLYKIDPPTEVLQFVERVPMFKGRLDRHGSTATSYAWLVWRKGLSVDWQTRLHWIAPCRARLERDSDYQTERESP